MYNMLIRIVGIPTLPGGTTAYTKIETPSKGVFFGGLENTDDVLQRLEVWIISASASVHG